MGGLLEAYVSGSPVLHLTGQVETRYLDAGKGFIHEVPDQPAMLAALSKSVSRAGTAGEIAAVVAAAISQACSAPQGPVSVELPIDLQYADTPATSRGDRPTPRPGVPVSAASRRPCALESSRAAGRSCGPAAAPSPRQAAGGGCRTGAPPRRRAAHDAERPRHARRGRSPLYRQPLLGRRRAGACREADLLVAVGTRYQGPNTENWKMAASSEPSSRSTSTRIAPGRNYEATVAVAADAKAALRAILRALPSRCVRRWTPTRVERMQVAASAASALDALGDAIGAQEGLLDELAAAIGPDTVVVKDSTIPAYTWGNRLLPVARQRRAIMPNGFAIGLGLAHALGAAAASACRLPRRCPRSGRPHGG